MSDARPPRLLLVGASGTLGQALALGLARRGAELVLMGRRLRVLEQVYDQVKAAGAPDPAIFELDLESAGTAQMDQLAETLARELGGLDGLLIASGRLSGLYPVAQHDPQEWLRTLHVNLSAPFLLLQTLLPMLAESRGYAALMLADPAYSGRAYWGAYGAAQAGLRQLVTSAAAECEQTGPRVLGLTLPAFRGAMRKLIYPGEIGDQLPEAAQVAQMVLALLDSDARGLQNVSVGPAT
ncbi:MAG: SDR family NAD(P)-dependent oxidoreductase [Xanthomonadales bacterium]|jgi:NAD(P)-dependent dehydrogenase (short-subunit alcohol dehydrogenase family)|nr:SDR family NAD(P)-dependent oxidoreductase [Xanthomonadales bacterium]